MDAILLAGCGALTWAGAFVATGMAGATRPGGSRRVQRALRSRLLAPLVDSGVPGMLLRNAHWRSACEGISLATAERLDAPLERVEASALGLCCVALAPAAGALFSVSPVGAVASGCMAAGALVGWGWSRELRRSRALAEEMPGVFRALSSALGSGQTLTQAIAYVGAHEKGEAAHEFFVASLRLRCGMGVSEVLDQLDRELDAPGVGLLVTALSISQRTGSPLRELFQRSANLVESHRQMERELVVKTAQVRLSARVVCLLPLALVGILSLISPDFQEGAATPLGMGCLLVALAMDGAALVIMRRLMREVL